MLSIPGITFKSIDWQDVRENKLETEDLEITFTGNVTFTFGVTKQAIYLKDIVGKVKPKLGTCLLHLSECDKGFNFRINLKVFKFTGYLPLIGGSADKPNGIGIAMVYMYGQLKVM